MRLLITLACITTLLCGCATTQTTTTTTFGPDGKTPVSQVIESQPGSVFGPSSYDMGYRDMYVSQEQSKVVRAAAINSQPCAPQDASCPALKIMGIAMMSMERFDVKAPTTGFDVMNHAVDSIVPVSGFLSLYKLGVAGVTNAGSKFGDNATLTNSMNHTDPSSVNFGAGSAGSSATSTPTNTPTTNSGNTFTPATTTGNNTVTTP